MKIRTSFVSNSSSSSFVVLGVKFPIVATAQALGLQVNIKETEAPNMITAYFNILRNKLHKSGKVTIENCKEYFDGEAVDECIIGKTLLKLSDGCVTEIPLPTVLQIKEVIELIEQAGLSTEPKDVKIYAQYVSNDNY